MITIKQVFEVQGEKNRNLEGLIENFLGEDILNNPGVRNSKLTEAENRSLESDFTLTELDEVAKDLNLKSAGGLDGINNALINPLTAGIGRISPGLFLNVPIKTL
jgi:hypothetical protein